MNTPTWESFVVFAVVMLVVITSRFVSSARVVKKALIYRLRQSRTLHVADDETARRIEKSLALLGCQIRLRRHGVHFDLKFHCPQWKTVEFVDVDKTKDWELWMQSLGFETRCPH